MKAKPKSAASNKARAKKPQPKSSRRKLAAALTAAGAVAAAVLIYMLAVAPISVLSSSSPRAANISTKNGIAYVPADVNYEPFAVGQPYAEAGSITLHEIPGLDPKQWLTEKYRGVGAIYHSDEIELPGLDGWQAGAVLVCESDVITVQKAEITDRQRSARLSPPPRRTRSSPSRSNWSPSATAIKSIT